MNILDKILSVEEKKQILEDLFYFTCIIDGTDGMLIYDEEGEEFYGYDRNLKWDFSTWRGIIDYQKHLSMENGRYFVQKEIKKILDI